LIVIIGPIKSNTLWGRAKVATVCALILSTAGCADIDVDALNRNLAQAYAFNQATTQRQVDALNAQASILSARSTAIQAVPTASYTPSSVTATWTGRQQQVTTITNQQAIACEYTFAGQTFVRLFQSFCAPTVQAR
jgi:hypothetical protein